MKLSNYLALLAVAIIGSFHLVSGELIEFCAGQDFEEPCIEDDITDECSNIPEDLDNKISYLSTRGKTCVTMYDLPNCQGRSININLEWHTGYQKNVPEEFDDLASSARLC